MVLALAAAFAAPYVLADDPATDASAADAVQPSAPVAGEAHVTADHIGGEMNNVLQARGDVVVTRDDQKLVSDWLDYYQSKNRIKAGDHFTLTRQHDRVDGTLLDYNLDSRTGSGLKPVFRSTEPGREIRGNGSKVEFLGKDNYRVFQSAATTCAPGDDSWYLKSSRLDLDYTTGVGTSHNSTLVFQGVPILYSPWFDFSLDGKRKSGFLYPWIKGGSNGAELALPYYWNIAPNYDATITPHINLRHGFMLGTEFRLLEPSYNGWLYTEQTPKDQVTNEHRYLWSGAFSQKLTNNLTWGFDGTSVSDDNYFSDFGDRVSIAANVNVVREAWANYNYGWTSGSATVNLLAQRYQTLQATGTTVTPPYARLPQLTLTANQNLPYGLVANLTTQATEFSHPYLQNGKRMVAYPSISLPIERAWGFIKPKLGFNYTEYQLDNYQGVTGHNVTRSLPVASVDSGLYFDRQVNMFDSDLTQTLEPRLYYLYIPTRDQSNIPNFDSSQNDFGFAQIFSESDYSGWDRISGANQITGALTSQLIDNDTGREILRAAIGQRYYFNQKKVNLDGTLSDRTNGASDFLASLGGEVIKNWNLDTLYQYSVTRHAPQQYYATLRYQPAEGKVVAMRYRFYNDNQVNASGYPENLHEVDLGVQWPITPKWYGLARIDYSLQDRQALQKLLGVEYNAGCWVLRLVGERYVTNLTQTKTTLFLEIELKGLGSLGSSPLDTLRQAIPGYSKTNNLAQ